MLIEVRDNAIWVRHLAADSAMQRRIEALPADSEIRLKVDGIVGTWCKMHDGRDGRPTQGIRPIGAMATVWARLQSRRGEKVTLEWPDDAPDPIYALADAGFDEWYLAEDEEAFGALRPL